MCASHADQPLPVLFPEMVAQPACFRRMIQRILHQQFAIDAARVRVCISRLVSPAAGRVCAQRADHGHVCSMCAHVRPLCWSNRWRFFHTPY
jgi:hypothetical protein